MNPDQKFFNYIAKWAADHGCTFEIESYDGHESPDLIDGMAVDDVWGWLVPIGVSKNEDEHYGCLEWSVKGGKLSLSWNKYDSI